MKANTWIILLFLKTFLIDPSQAAFAYKDDYDCLEKILFNYEIMGKLLGMDLSECSRGLPDFEILFKEVKDTSLTELLITIMENTNIVLTEGVNYLESKDLDFKSSLNLLDDIKESGRPAEDADVVISLFDPIRFKTTDPGYKVTKFINPLTGGNYFRKVKILKNTYGEDQIGVGMGFYGATGIFTELPKSKEMEDFDYEKLFDHTYFKK